MNTRHTDSLRKKVFIVDLCFNPFHQQLNVLYGWQLCWPLVIHSITPVILIPVNIAKHTFLTLNTQIYTSKNITLMHAINSDDNFRTK